MLREAGLLDGVVECRHAHFWQFAPGRTVGSVNLRLRSTADELDTVGRVRGWLLPHVFPLLLRSLSLVWCAPVAELFTNASGLHGLATDDLTVSVEREDWASWDAYAKR